MNFLSEVSIWVKPTNSARSPQSSTEILLPLGSPCKLPPQSPWSFDLGSPPLEEESTCKSLFSQHCVPSSVLVWIIWGLTPFLVSASYAVESLADIQILVFTFVCSGLKKCLQNQISKTNEQSCQILMNMMPKIPVKRKDIKNYLKRITKSKCPKLQF